MDIKKMLAEARRKQSGMTGYIFKISEYNNKLFLYRMEDGEEVANYFFSGDDVLDYDFGEFREQIPMTEEEFRGLSAEWNKAKRIINKELRGNKVII